jgi:hypothetical protein
MPCFCNFMLMNMKLFSALTAYWTTRGPSTQRDSLLCVVALLIETWWKCSHDSKPKILSYLCVLRIHLPMNYEWSLHQNLTQKSRNEITFQFFMIIKNKWLNTLHYPPKFRLRKFDFCDQNFRQGQELCNVNLITINFALFFFGGRMASDKWSLVWQIPSKVHSAFVFSAIGHAQQCSLVPLLLFSNRRLTALLLVPKLKLRSLTKVMWLLNPCWN